MSEIIKSINLFFNFVIREDVEKVRNDIILSERQMKIFNMFYLEKHDINFIADSLGVCSMVINNELKVIRIKLMKIIDTE